MHKRMDWFIPISVGVAVLLSNIIKELFHIYTQKTFSWYVLLLQTGGMPSSHSAAVTALTVAIYLSEGIPSLFWLSVVFSAIIIRDSFGVRKSVSDQAAILNNLLSQAKMKEKVKIVLGHTPLQVAVGVCIGFFTPVVIYTI